MGAISPNPTRTNAFPLNFATTCRKTVRPIVLLLPNSISKLILNYSENFKSSSNFSRPSWNHL